MIHRVAGIAALVAASLSGQAQATSIITVPTNQYLQSIDTGLRNFAATLDDLTFSDTAVLRAGSSTIDTAPRQTSPVYDQNFGAFQGSVSLVTFSGYPFLTKFSVEGAVDHAGDKVVAHETVNGSIEMLVNGALSQSTGFSVVLSPSCTSGADGFSILLCSDQQKQAFFSQSVPVVLPQGAVVTFDYKITENDISCEIDPVGGGNPGVCISGGTGFTDLANINDPPWQATLTTTFDYIPEPATMTVFGAGLLALTAARRARRAAAPH